MADLFKEHEKLITIINGLKDKYSDYPELVSFYTLFLRSIEECNEKCRYTYPCDNSGIKIGAVVENNKSVLCIDLDLIRECLQYSDSLATCLRCFPLLNEIIDKTDIYVDNMEETQKIKLKEEVMTFLRFSERVLKFLDKREN